MIIVGKLFSDENNKFVGQLSIIVRESLTRRAPGVPLGLFKVLRIDPFDFQL